MKSGLGSPEGPIRPAPTLPFARSARFLNVHIDLQPPQKHAKPPSTLVHKISAFHCLSVGTIDLAQDFPDAQFSEGAVYEPDQ